MNNTGPNPKFIFQGLVLVGSLLIFVILFLIQKQESGKSKEIKGKETRRLFAYSWLLALILVVLTFLVFYLINN
jgi:hypothetical protein